MIGYGEETKINVTYQKTIYESDNDYRMILVEGTKKDIHYPDKNVEREDIVFTAKGKFLKPTFSGQTMEMTGEWVFDKKYKTPAFEVKYIILSLPKDKKQEKAFLLNIKGIGNKLADRLVEATDGNIEKCLRNELELIASVKGFTASKAHELSVMIREFNMKNEISNLLKDRVRGECVNSIVAHYGAKSLEVIYKAPFSMAADRVISFSEADSIFLSLGGGKLDAVRINAGITIVMQMLISLYGSIIIKRDECIDYCSKLLQIEAENVQKRLLEMLKEKMLIPAGDYIYLWEDYCVEKKLAGDIVKFQKLNIRNEDSKRYLKCFDLWKRNGAVPLAERQEQAVKACADNALTIITGGPGTGKTTTLKAIIDCYKMAFPQGNISLMAPTGLAAKRMSDACGMKAQTIHKMFGLVPANNTGSFDASQGTTLSGGLVIIDEFSMVGIHLAQYVFSSIIPQSDTRIVIVGDVDQLPPVSPGSVLDDMIACNKVVTTKLDRNFRQEAGSRIIDAAYKINAGQTDIDYSGNLIFKDVTGSTVAEQTKQIVEEIKAEFLQSVNTFGLEQTFILTPKRKVKINKRDGSVDVNFMLSSSALNPIIRDLVNPAAAGKSFYKSGAKLFRTGDRVINLQNSEQVMNGEIGIITKIVAAADAEDQGITVDYSGVEVEYPPEKIKNLDLAYCITVHKSQGGEYDSVLFPASMTNEPMLVRNLLYTAVTRAKKQVVMIGDKKSISKAIITKAVKTKRDFLSARIIKASI